MTQVTISKGFEWFRYQLGPLDYANLPARLNDGIKSYYWTCGSTLRMAAVNQPIQITSQNATGNVLLTLTPQPITQTATISLNNFNCDNPQAVTLQCYDATGRAMDILAVTKAVKVLRLIVAVCVMGCGVRVNNTLPVAFCEVIWIG